MVDLDFGDVNHFYSKYYDLVLRTGFTGAAQDRTHRAIEKRWSKDDEFEQVLEVGAGAGDHKRFVDHQYQIYYETDIRFANDLNIGDLNQKQPEVESGLVREFADLTQLHYKDDTFDRVIATCLLLHLEKPEIALREAHKVTKKKRGDFHSCAL